MGGFKTFYNEKKGKYILFFGFYLIFFIALAIYLRSVEVKKPEEDNNQEQEVEVITTYDISNLINNDYQYHIEIQDNKEEITFNGKKSEVDYANYEYKYFLDIYNLNQLLKRSNFIKNENNILIYELSNSEINDILVTNKNDGTNTIKVMVNDNSEIEQINLDLSNYLEKDNYEITIDYVIGEENENSSS